MLQNANLSLSVESFYEFSSVLETLLNDTQIKQHAIETVSISFKMEAKQKKLRQLSSALSDLKNPDYIFCFKDRFSFSHEACFSSVEAVPDSIKKLYIKTLLKEIQQQEKSLKAISKLFNKQSSCLGQLVFSKVCNTFIQGSIENNTSVKKLSNGLQKRLVKALLKEATKLKIKNTF